MSREELGSTTHWTIVLAAADGDAEARETFATRYLPVVRAYLRARWRGRAAQSDLEDAVQEVFVDCLRDDGALTRVEREHQGSFRSYLAGVTRNIALRFETGGAKRRQRIAEDERPDDTPDEEARLTKIFDRAWAQSLVQEAAERLTAAAEQAGPEAVRRVELLRRRYHEGNALKDVAEEWGVPAKAVYREIERARAEYAAILRRVVGEREGCQGEELTQACEQIMKLLR
ncbi:MAG: sigma-70 family RNA polymerase sigma factor [Planctomycetota bacterium]